MGEKVFHCDQYHVDMPEEKQQGFCAKRYRRAAPEDHCSSCDRGREAAKKDKDGIIDKLPKDRGNENGRRAQLIRHAATKEEDIMAEKKKCSCGCGKNAIKEGLAWGCYSKKFGKPPYGHGGTKTAPAKAKPSQAKHTPSKLRRVKGNGHRLECEGCKALQLQIDDINRVEKIMVAAGLVDPGKFEQARKIVRELC